MWLFSNSLAKLKRDEAGQTAVFFALLAVPLLAITSASMDYSNVVREKEKIKGALDAAVIAAVNNNAIRVDEKGEFAKSHFTANYDGGVSLTLTPQAEESEVALTANGEVKLSFGQLIGMKNPVVSARSRAVIASENTICVLALSKTDNQAIRIDGDLTYLSPSCTVHANSSSKKAISSSSSVTPRAKSFCAVGGTEGDFLPYSKGECKTIADPYASTFPPFVGACMNLADAIKPKQANGIGINANNALDNVANVSLPIEIDIDTGQSIPVSPNVTGDNVEVAPGTICGGLTVDGINVTFPPGEYIIKDGPLTFTNGAEATATDVTFILVGDGAEFNVQKSANVTIKAPSTGERKGLAVMEIEDSSAPGNRPKTNKKSRITSGGQLTVTGTIYLPDQALEVKGDGTQIGSKAPATSFIADTIRFTGKNNAVVEVNIDHVAAGIPPILPRAEDGAMLVE